MARQWLIDEREKLNLNGPQMAERVGIGYDYYRKIELGERQQKMDITIAAKLSVALNMPITKIIELEESNNG